MEDWGKEIFPEGVGVKWKNGQGKGEGKEKCPTPTPMSPLHQSSTGQASKMAATYCLLLHSFRLNIPKGSVKAPAVDLLRLNNP